MGEKRRWAGEGAGYQELLPHQDQILFFTLHHGRSKMNSLQHLVSKNSSRIRIWIQEWNETPLPYVLKA
jgi:hypothetical protein